VLLTHPEEIHPTTAAWIVSLGRVSEAIVTGRRSSGRKEQGAISLESPNSLGMRFTTPLTSESERV